MKTKIASALGCVLALTAAATPQKSATLVVSGYAGSTTLTDFPLLVRVSDIPGFLYDDCAANGADVWFASDAAGANPLPHEIDTWDVTSNSCAWVKVPSISGTATTLYMFWKDSAPPANDPTDVWGEYAGVWHLGEATGSATAADATGHGLGATVSLNEESGQGPAAKTAMIGNGRWIPKTSLEVPNYDDLAVGSVFTASGWFYLDERTAKEKLFIRSEFVEGCDGWTVWMNDNRDMYYSGGGSRQTGSVRAPSGSFVGRWIYVAAVYNDYAASLYVPSEGKKAGPSWIYKAMDNGLPLTVGGRVKGTVDEIRIRKAISSDDWIQAEYDSVNSAAFVTGVMPANSILVKGDTRLQGEKALGYGLKENLASGTTYTYTQQEYATNVAETIEYVCAGWELTLTNGTVTASTEETKRSCSFTYAAAYDGATLTWKWVPSRYWLAVATVGGGTVDVASQFVTTGGVVTLTATPASGQRFWKWTGDAALADPTSASIDVTVGEPMTVTAKFYDPATARRAKAYVVPGGAGTKDGTSWANASGSVALAYAAAADSPVGGDVYLKAGVYTIAAPIAMEPNVTVAGGVDGGETILSGDLEQPDVWVTRTNMTFSTAILQDGVIYLPDYPADRIDFYRSWEPDSSWAKYDTPNAFVCASKDAPNNVFTNLTMMLFRKGVIVANGASADGLQVVGCKFYGNNHEASYDYAASDAGVIDIRAGMVTVRDCLFRYNMFGVNIAEINDKTEERRSRIVKCQFLGDVSNEQGVSQTISGGTVLTTTGGAAGVTVRNNALVDIEGCTFYRCGSSAGLRDSRVGAGAVAIYGTGPDGCGNTISNCVFDANCSCGAYCRGPAVVVSQGGLLEVVGCSFVNNLYYPESTIQYASGTIYHFDGRLIVRDSYFSGNAIEHRLTGYGNLGSVYAGNGTATTFVNCTVESNRTNLALYDPRIGESGEWGHVGPSTFYCPDGAHFALVNCLVKDNDVFVKDGIRRYEFGRNTVGRNSDFAIVNTIITHTADDYKAFVSPFSNQRSTVLATSVIANFDWGEDVSQYTNPNWGLGCLITPVKPTSELDPMVSAKLRRQGYVLARGLEAEAPKTVRRGGTPVYRGTDDRYYLRNPNAPASASAPWWPLEDHNNRLTDAEAEALGVTTASALVPDAFGSPRKSGKVAFGPLNGVTSGFIFIMR